MRSSCSRKSFTSDTPSVGNSFGDTYDESAANIRVTNRLCLFLLNVFFPRHFEFQNRCAYLFSGFQLPALECQYRISNFDVNTFRYRFANGFLIFIIFIISNCFVTTDLYTDHLAKFCAAVSSILFISLCCSYPNKCYTPNTMPAVIALHSVFILILPPLLLVHISKMQKGELRQAVFNFHFIVYATMFIIAYCITKSSIVLNWCFAVLHAAIYAWLFHQDSMANVYIDLLCFLMFHVICSRIAFIYNILSREYFMKVGRDIINGKQLQKEVDIRQGLMNSIMPIEVSKSDFGFSDGVKRSRRRRKTDLFKKSNFRKLKIEEKTDTSILFADIVGFTRMSSFKEASELVSVLNDLYKMFDLFAEMTGCVKVATLGDCYYCVSGCPGARDDHAKCCVEMGNAMIIGMNEFDKNRALEAPVKMRVGIHTGRVMFGLIGVTRYKFDVLSSDVFIANEMESMGRPNEIHISQETYDSLKAYDPVAFEKDYAITLNATLDPQSELLKGKKTYFIELRNPRFDYSEYLLEKEEKDNKPDDEDEDMFVKDADKFITQDAFIKELHGSQRGRMNVFSRTPLRFLTLSFVDSTLEDEYKRYASHKKITDCTELHINSKACFFSYSVTILLIVFELFSIKPYYQFHFIHYFVFFICIAVMFDILTVVFNPNWLTPYLIFTVLANRKVDFLFNLLLILWPLILVFCFGCDKNSMYLQFLAINAVHLLNVDTNCILRLFVLIGNFFFVIFPFNCWTSQFHLVVYFSYFLFGALIYFVIVDLEFIRKGNFYIEKLSEENIRTIRKYRAQADLQVLNILPSFVAKNYKSGSKFSNYSQTRENVGVVFFFIDFWAVYSEDYKGGKEWIRCLNELICELDEVLNNASYDCIEKIKTIQSTYLVANNLNPSIEQDWREQLTVLMNFVVHINEKLIDFSDQMPGMYGGFDFKVGVNHGRVTSGIIGTSGLYFDIWGDTVNIASRMYSTSENRQIQITAHTKEALVEAGTPEKHFIKRGFIYCKGKGDMMTYYYKNS